MTTGWKHRENFKAYYQTFAQQWEVDNQAKEMANQMQMMQQMPGGGMGMMPPPDHMSIMQQQHPFGGPGSLDMPPLRIGMPPNMMMGGQPQQFPQYHMGGPGPMMGPGAPPGPPRGRFMPSGPPPMYPQPSEAIPHGQEQQ
jgi:hypothetical protein